MECQHYFVPLANGLKMQTIAAFVENDDIKQRLIDLDIYYAQGYGIHTPSPLKSYQPLNSNCPASRQFEFSAT